MTENDTISQDNQTRVMQGAHDMLKEAAKQFRLNDDQGHASMCELHVDQLFEVLSLLPKPAPLLDDDFKTACDDCQCKECANGECVYQCRATLPCMAPTTKCLQAIPY